MSRLRLSLFGGAIVAITAILIVVYWKGRLEGAAHERPKTEAAVARAAVATLEAQGARETAARVDVVVRNAEAAQRIAQDAKLEALKSEDANVPLAADRAARLHDSDRRLCELAPDLDGCAA